MINTQNNMSKFISKVYMWMFIGLLVSGGLAYYTSTNLNLIKMVYTNFTWIILLEFIVVIGFTALRNKVSADVAKILFLVYSAISGVTLSSIFLVYKIGSIGVVFLASALFFALMAIYGYITNTNLMSFGKILIFALFAIIIMSIINIFLNNGSLGIILSILSIVIFLGLTAYDMQRLKMTYDYYSTNEEELNKASIYGALDLYLDFVNIFLRLLQLFGKRRD